MTMAYIRSKYNVPAKKGMKVAVEGKQGIITGTKGTYLMVLLDGDKESKPRHPTCFIDYLDGDVQ